MSVEFKDNSIVVKGAIDDASRSFLLEASELLKASIAQITKVRSGQLKGSWDYKADFGKMESQVGSPLENALWNEFGTGEYALNGDGRKGGWSYQDASGKWHHTYGKRPQRTLGTAFNSTKASIVSRAEKIFKDRMK